MRERGACIGRLDTEVLALLAPPGRSPTLYSAIPSNNEEPFCELAIRIEMVHQFQKASTK